MLLCVQICQGGDIPEKYYMTNMTETSRDEMERVIIGRGSSHKVTLEVDKSGSVIQWEFVSTEYDIAFGIYHKVQEEKGKKAKNELVMNFLHDTGVFKLTQEGREGRKERGEVGGEGAGEGRREMGGKEEDGREGKRRGGVEKRRGRRRMKLARS